MTASVQDLALDWTLPELLSAAVERWPDKTFLRSDGLDISFSVFDAQVAALAGALSERGLTPGGRLGVFMRNSLACVQTWFAANRLAATWVPINTEWRGSGLANAIRLAEPTLLVSDDDLSAHLQAALGDSLPAPLLVALASADLDGSHELGHLLGASPIHDSVASRYSDTAGMLYTSGTTGRSKACVLSHRYFVSQAAIAVRDFGLVHEDVLYCPFPLFHADATALTVVPALLTGATAAIGRRFSASRFWSEVRAVEATVFDFMGATLSILQKADPKADDTANPVRLAWGVPVPAWAPQFEERFDLKLLELYGSVEANLPITQRHDQARVLGSCGRAIPEFEVAVVDDKDTPMPPGLPGELVVRPRVPYTTFNGYFADGEATAEAFRNLWFHSGDVMRQDEDGNFYFIGRKSESIRRRGENVSAHEVEEGVLAHEAVLECAAVGVPSELTEEDVKVFVVRKPGKELSAEELWSFCAGTMARFQVPRYIEFIGSLPKTPTGKISKVPLRDLPAVGAATWQQDTGTAAIAGAIPATGSSNSLGG
jgi:carnitine-CoA ligase